MCDYTRIARILLQKMSDTLDDFVLQNALLNLRELENDWYKSSQISFSINTYLFTILQTIKSNIYDVLVK